MDVSRLDEIVKNNVDFSTQKSREEQMLFVLQDISVTLAMIYDKLNKPTKNQNDESDNPLVDETPTFIHKSELNKYIGKSVCIDIKTLCYIVTIEEISEQDITLYACDAKYHVNGSMLLSLDDYNKTYRLWSSTPSQEDKDRIEWEK